MERSSTTVGLLVVRKRWGVPDQDDWRRGSIVAMVQRAGLGPSKRDHFLFI